MACFIGRNAGYVDAGQDIGAWVLDDPTALWTEARGLLFDHGVALFIFSVHLLKTTLATERLTPLCSV